MASNAYQALAERLAQVRARARQRSAEFAEQARQRSEEIAQHNREREEATEQRIREIRQRKEEQQKAEDDPNAKNQWLQRREAEDSTFQFGEAEEA
jgi:hypothetical protein